MYCVYRWICQTKNNEIRYVGETHGKQATIEKRTEAHSRESMFFGHKWIVEYIDGFLFSETDTKALESHFIYLFNPDLNVKKLKHGLCSFIKGMNFEWKQYCEIDLTNKVNPMRTGDFSVRPRYDCKNRLLSKNEYQNKNTGRYEYVYYLPNGIKKKIYSWCLLPSDEPPFGKHKDICLRDKELKISGEYAELFDVDLNTAFSNNMANRNLGEKTRTNYHYMFSHFIQPKFGNRKLRQISSKQLLQYYNQLIDDNGFSPNTIEVIHTILSPVFRDAYKSGIIDRIPTDGIIDNIKQHEGFRKRNN